MESPHPTRSSHVATIVGIFLGVTQMKQKALTGPLGLSESQVSRKMKGGSWTVDEIDRLAKFFGVAVSDFFEDPEVVRSRILGGPLSRWITTPQCEGQLALLTAA